MKPLTAWAKRKPEAEESTRASVEELPPFLAMSAVYRDRLRVMKTWVVGVTVVMGLLVAIQEVRLHGALSNYTSREILIVPGAVDFMRVRPNLVPDIAVYEFGRFMAEMVGSFSWKNIESRADYLAGYFAPAFAEKYRVELRQQMKMYRELQVVEMFSPRPITKFELAKDAGGNPYYVVHVQGQLDRYSSDAKLLTEEHVITIKFRTSPIKPDKPWFFEVLDIARLTMDEFKREEDARKALQAAPKPKKKGAI